MALTGMELWQTFPRHSGHLDLRDDRLTVGRRASRLSVIWMSLSNERIGKFDA